MNRRQSLGLGAAGVAAAGLGFWWSGKKLTVETPGDRPPEDLWTIRLAQPQGGELALADLRGRPLLLNFWATWCPPCIRELPDIEHFHRQHQAQGWQVVGVAVDGPTAVREFLARMPLTFPIGLAGLEGTELSRSLGNTSGALPFTVVLNAKGIISQRKLGATNREELERWAAST